MKSSPVRLPFIGFAAIGIAACRQEPPSAPELVVLTAVDTLVPAASQLLHRPTELTVDDRGRLFVTDAGRNAVMMLDSTGAMVGHIGRAGSGPGELQSPRSVSVSGDTVRILDAGNGRISTFTTRGDAVRTQPAPVGALGGAVAFDGQGGGVIGRNGADSALAQRFHPDGTSGPRLGRPVVPVSGVWDFGAIKREIRDGRVPANIRNIVLPVCLADGGVWLLLQTEASAERYDGRDSLVARIRIREPELEAIRDDFFARNRADSAGDRFYPLSYFVSAREVGTDLWVLLRQPASDPTTLLVLDRAGRISRRIRIPGTTGIRGFAWSPDRQSLYLLAFDDAAILRARVPVRLAADRR